MTIGFEPFAAYDKGEDKIYYNIKIDKQGNLKELKKSYSKALAFAVSIAYPVKETLRFILGKAAMHEKIIKNLTSQENLQGGQE
ncbi:MAG: hypothetical protein AABY22_33930 [Nanoarchaeota archaeon]